MSNFNIFKSTPLLFCLVVLSAADFMEENFPASVIEDAYLDTPHLLMKYKYPFETHYVTTKDNYVLCLHRIAKPEGRPIFLMHGLLDSSSTWIFMGPGFGLGMLSGILYLFKETKTSSLHFGIGYYLYEQGYDIWMGNARGNRYSRNHTTYNPNIDRSFWNFSWDEIGYIDLPTMIDYVLQQTNNEKLTYFGHSQGTTTFFVMCSLLPEYNSKINSMHALAPVAFMKNIKTPLISLARSIIFSTSFVPEMFPHSNIFLKGCMGSKILLQACVDNFWNLVGKETNQMNATMWPVVFSHLPAGASSLQGRHFIELVDSNRFCRYDHGPIENMRRYGAITPPDYPIEKITAPIGLYYAYNDYLTSEVDVERLARFLPNVVEKQLYPYREWNHLTMMWGIETRELAHKHMLEVLKKFE